jgi:hypothetical protein
MADEVTTPEVKKIWCPHCGHHHIPTPLTYPLENEIETFQEELAEFETEGEGEDTVVTLPTCFIEAGPYSETNSRYLMEQDLKLLDCPACNKTFAME